MFMNLVKLINKSAKTTEGCQRNWDYSYEIPQEHIDAIVNTAVTMPTKQNEEYYNLVVSTDLTFNYSLYLKTFTDESGQENYGRNAQVNAPLLLIWIKNPKFVGVDNNYDLGGFSIGVSGGGTALAANMLGYRTGFCKCFSQKKIIGLLREKNIITTKVELALGVGMPDPEMPDRNFVKIQNEIKKFQKRIKNIKIYSI